MAKTVDGSGDSGRRAGRSDRGAGASTQISQGTEIAARRLIRGHLNTDGLDPVTAKAMELLAAVDVVAAEDRPPTTVTTTTMCEKRRWHDPLFAAMLAGLVCLVLLSLGYWQQTNQAANLHQQARNIQQLQHQNQRVLAEIESCTTPKGECTQRNAKGTQGYIDQIVERLTFAVCKLAHPDASVAVIRACAIQTTRQS